MRKERTSPWTFVPMREEYGKQICGWRYPAPYTGFNWPAWELLSERSEEFADPAIRREQYEAVVDERGELCGFVQFFPLEGWIRLGLGLKPERCGQGSGVLFVASIVRRAMERSPHHKIDLEVQTFNARAIRVYRKAGFVIADTYERGTRTGPDRVHCMVFEGGPNLDMV